VRAGAHQDRIPVFEAQSAEIHRDAAQEDRTGGARRGRELQAHAVGDRHELHGGEVGIVGRRDRPPPGLRRSEAPGARRPRHGRTEATDRGLGEVVRKMQDGAAVERPLALPAAAGRGADHDGSEGEPASKLLEA